MKKSSASFLLFLAISLIYFLQSLINDLLPNHFDIYGYFYPIMGLVRDQYLQGALPLWNSYMFSGFPLMASPQHAVFYPLSIVPMLILPLSTSLALQFVIHYTLAGFFTYLYARKAGAENFAAIIAGTVFAFMGYLMSHIGHVSILRTGIWLPLILYFYEDLRLRQSLKSALFASLAIALQILAGHPQIYFYSWLVMLFYVAFYLPWQGREKRLRFAGLCALSFGLGLIIASPQLYATYELATHGIRSSLNYATFSSFSFPAKNMASFIFPMLYAENTEAYLGMLPVLLAISAFVTDRKKNIHIWFWAALAAISLVLALGDDVGPLNRLMYHVPIYNNFRGVSKHLLEFCLAISVLGAFGISTIVSGDKAKRSLILILVLVCAVLAGYVFMFQISDMNSLRWDVISHFALMVGTIATVAFLIKARKYDYFKYIVALWIMFEILSFKSSNWIDAKKITHHREDLFTELSKTEDRVAFYADGIMVPLAMRYGISLVGGYDPLLPGNYDLLFEMRGVGGRPDNWMELVENNHVLSMLNARYLVLPPDFSLADSDPPRYKELFTSDEYAIYENLMVLPRAYRILELVAIDEMADIKKALLAEEINPSEKATVSESDLKQIGSRKFSDGTVEVLDHHHDGMTIQTDFGDEGLVVISEQFYPGWRAEIDGEQTDIYRINGILMGVAVPAGTHKIVFAYRPYRIYALIFLSVTILIGTVLYSVRIKDY